MAIDSAPRRPTLRKPDLRRTAPVLMLGAVALGSVSNMALLPGWISSHDKLVHMAAYAALTVLLMRILPDRRTWPIAAIGLSGAGLGIEAWQFLLPSRQAEPLDALANVAGVALAWMLLHGASSGSWWRERGPERCARGAPSPSENEIDGVDGIP